MERKVYTDLISLYEQDDIDGIKIYLDGLDFSDENIRSKLDIFLNYNSKNGDVEVVKELLNRGIQNEKSLISACENYREDVVREFLLNNMNLPHDILVKTVLLNNSFFVKEFLEKDIDPNFKGKNGITPLMLAVKKCSINIVNILLRSGSNVNDSDKNGKTVLMYSRLNVINCLLKYNLDINQVDKRGNTALIIACMKQNLSKAKKLIREGAEYKTINKKGQDYGYFLGENDKKEIEEYIGKHTVNIKPAIK